MDNTQTTKLLQHLLGTQETDFETLKDAFYEKYLIDIHNVEDFASLVKDLLDRAYLGFDKQTPSVGFSDGENWFVSKEHESPFIFSIVRYLTQGFPIPDGKGFARTIVIDGVPKYKITIGKAE